ncbi:MAG: adenylate/guanylate cyclase domain-containing protein [Aliishimia sp.]
MRFPITIILMLALGGLTGVSVGSVLLVSASASLKNTQELSAKRAELTVTAIERGITDNLAPAQNMINEIARRVDQGILDLADRNRLAATLGGALASAPQLGGVVIWQPEVDELWVRSTASGKITERDVDGLTRAEFDAIAQRFDHNDQISWGAPTFFDRQTFINIRRPIVRDGVIVAVVATGISLSSLSSLVGDLAVADLTPFILFGDDKVLGHPALLDPEYSGMLSGRKALLSVMEIDDPALAAFPDLEESRSSGVMGLDVRVAESDSGASLILSRASNVFGPVPWRIGAYMPVESVNGQFRRLVGSILVGIGMLIVSVGASLFLARRMARPITAISAAAKKIERLELDAIVPLQRSRIRELDEQANSFNRMVQGLRWFQAYVPRRLVQQLMDQTGGPNRGVHEADLTVMFTDVIGFTALSEALPPSQIGALLNEHFETTNKIVEAEKGTLDKFIGDAAMVFWGAPDPMPDHATHACRAALAIDKAVTALNAKTDGPALRVKIGLHSGPLIVGNIGARTRMNYTVIGDTVNVCARLEALAGSHAEDRDVTILVSSEVVEAVGNAFVFEPIGDQFVKGREQAVSVWRLVGAKD